MCGELVYITGKLPAGQWVPERVGAPAWVAPGRQRGKTYAWGPWVAPGEQAPGQDLAQGGGHGWPSGGFHVAHGEARRVLALAQGVTVDGAAGAAQEACSGAHAVAHDGAPPIGAGDGDGPFQGGWGRRLGAVGPVAPGVHEPQVAGPVVSPVAVDVVYQERAGVGAVVERPGDTVGPEAVLAQLHLNVALSVRAARRRPSVGVPPRHPPSEGAGFRAVGEDLAQGGQGRERFRLGHGGTVFASVAGGSRP